MRIESGFEVSRWIESLAADCSKYTLQLKNLDKDN